MVFIDDNDLIKVGQNRYVDNFVNQNV